MNGLAPQGAGATLVNSFADATARFRSTEIRVDHSGVVLGDSGFTRTALHGPGGVVTQVSTGDIHLQANSGTGPVGFISRDFRGQQILINALSGTGCITIGTANRPASDLGDMIRTTPLFVGSIQIQGPLHNPTVELDGFTSTLTVGSIKGHTGTIRVRNGARVIIAGSVPANLYLDIDEHSSVHIGERIFSARTREAYSLATPTFQPRLPPYAGN